MQRGNFCQGQHDFAYLRAAKIDDAVNHRALGSSQSPLALAFRCDLFQLFARSKKTSAFPSLPGYKYLSYSRAELEKRRKYDRRKFKDSGEPRESSERKSPEHRLGQN